MEISKNETGDVIDLLTNKNHYALIKNLHVFSGVFNKISVCGRCLLSYTNENMSMIHKPKCES